MMIQCPSCQKMYNVPETMMGKQVRCKGCSEVFAVVPQGQTPPPAAPQPQAPPPPALQDAPAARAEAPAGSQEAPAARTRYAQQRAAARKKMMILAGGGAVALLALVAVAVFVVVPMLSGGQPGWTRPLVPQGAQFIAYVDLASIRESDLYGKLMAMSKEMTGKGPEASLQDALGELNMKSKLKLDEVAGLFVAGSSPAEGSEVPKMVFGLRLTRPMELRDLINGVGVVPRKYSGKNYVVLGSGEKQICIAQLDEETFCGTPGEALLKKALDRVASGKSVELDKDLSSLLDAVDGKDSFVAGNLKGLPIPVPTKGAEGFGLGISMNGSVSATAVVAFKEEKQAKTLADEANEGLDTAREEARKGLDKMSEAIDKASGKQKEMMEKQLGMAETVAGWLDDIDVDQSGKRIEFSVSIDTDELLELFDMVKNMAGGLIPGGGQR